MIRSSHCFKARRHSTDDLQRSGNPAQARFLSDNILESDAICESKCGRRCAKRIEFALRLGQSVALPGSQIAFQINTVQVNTIKPHYTVLVNTIKLHHTRQHLGNISPPRFIAAGIFFVTHKKGLIGIFVIICRLECCQRYTIVPPINHKCAFFDKIYIILCRFLGRITKSYFDKIYCNYFYFVI